MKVWYQIISESPHSHKNAICKFFSFGSRANELDIFIERSYIPFSVIIVNIDLFYCRSCWEHYQTCSKIEITNKFTSHEYLFAYKTTIWQAINIWYWIFFIYMWQSSNPINVLCHILIFITGDTLSIQYKSQHLTAFHINSSIILSKVQGVKLTFGVCWPVLKFSSLSVKMIERSTIEPLLSVFNSLRANDAYMHWYSILSCHLVTAKPLSEPMLEGC